MQRTVQVIIPKAQKKIKRAGESFLKSVFGKKIAERVEIMRNMV